MAQDSPLLLLLNHFRLLGPHRRQPTRLSRPWDSPGKNTGVGCHFLLQRIFPTQGLNLGLLHCRQTPALQAVSLPLNIQGSLVHKYICVYCIWSHHFMANRWGNSDRLYFGGSKITADGDCSHEIKRCLPLERKAMTKIDRILKSRHYFANKVLSSQSCFFQ